jgi:hypothetical protein
MKILKHQNGHFVPKHEDVTANDVYRALKRFSLTLDQFTAGMGQHPEAEHIAALNPHFQKLWQIVVEMDQYPAETENTAPAAHEKWLANQRKAQANA